MIAERFAGLRNLRRAFFALAIFPLISACAESISERPAALANPRTSTESPSAVRHAPGTSKSTADQNPAADASEEDKAILQAADAIKRLRLTKIAEECLAYRLDASSKEHYTIDVRENHRHASCGGDPQTSPHLFYVRVARKTGAMTWDSGTEPSNFRPLPNK